MADELKTPVAAEAQHAGAPVQRAERCLCARAHLCIFSSLVGLRNLTKADLPQPSDRHVAGKLFRATVEDTESLSESPSYDPACSRSSWSRCSRGLSSRSNGSPCLRVVAILPLNQRELFRRRGEFPAVRPPPHAWDAVSRHV